MEAFTSPADIRALRDNPGQGQRECEIKARRERIPDGHEAQLGWRDSEQPANQEWRNGKRQKRADQISD